MIRIPSISDFFGTGVTPSVGVEPVQETKESPEPKKVQGRSPMSLFEEREKTSSHLSQKKLVAPEGQGSNGWYNPFAKFYSWVVQSIWGGADDASGLTEEDHKRVALYCQEVRAAMAALDDLILNDEEVKESFDHVMLLIQRQKEALHKKIVLQQNDAFQRAHKEVKEIHASIKKETEEYLHTLSRNGVLAKVSALITPLSGMVASTLLPLTGIPQVDMALKPIVFILSALAAANVSANNPFLNDHVSSILELSVGTSVSLTNMMGVVMLLAQGTGQMTRSYLRYSDSAFKGSMAVKDNERRLAEEKYNDLGDKAQSETSKYLKGVGQLAEMASANLELIKALWNR